MKTLNRYIFVALLTGVLFGCGQPGPLYLPKDQPSVYVEPKPVNDTGKKVEDNKPSTSEQPPTEPAPK